MNALTPQPQQSAAYSDQAALIIELAKCLKLVAPVSMGEDAQRVWLQAAADALDGIRAAEIAAVSAEVRRSCTSHTRIVSRIAELVSEKRARSRIISEPANPLNGAAYAIGVESRERRYRARNRDEVEDAWRWERGAMQDAGLSVPPVEKPLSRAELDNMDSAMVALGLKYGFLERREGELIERRAA